MKTLTKTKVIRLSEIEHSTLLKMKSYNINVGNFIREAISDKIKKEYQQLLPKQKEHCPF